MPQRLHSNAPFPLRRPLPRAAGAACVLLVFALAGAAMVPAGAQVRAHGTTSAASVSTAKPAAVSKPLWRDLSTRQQRALEPLALQWDSLTEPHKRKWLALSRNYAKLSPAEQEVLHSRMTEWATLSNQQRSQARLNFAEVKQVPVDERKAKWEAYQALSDEEKRKLAERAGSRPPSAAAPVRPVPAQKFAPVPSATNNVHYPPRIQLAPPAAPVPPAAVPAALVAPAAPASSATSATTVPSATTAVSATPPAPVTPAVPAAPAASPVPPKPQEAP